MRWRSIGETGGPSSMHLQMALGPDRVLVQVRLHRCPRSGHARWDKPLSHTSRGGRRISTCATVRAQVLLILRRPPEFGELALPFGMAEYVSAGIAHVSIAGSFLGWPLVIFVVVWRSSQLRVVAQAIAQAKSEVEAHRLHWAMAGAGSIEHASAQRSLCLFRSRLMIGATVCPNLLSTSNVGRTRSSDIENFVTFDLV